MKITKLPNKPLEKTELTRDVQTRDDKGHQEERQYDNELLAHLDVGARHKVHVFKLQLHNMTMSVCF